MANASTTEKPRSKSKSESSKEAVTERAKAQLEESLTQTQKALDKVAAQTADELRKAGDTSSKFIRENPAIAVAGALGVGVLIGFALRGRN